MDINIQEKSETVQVATQLDYWLLINGNSTLLAAETQLDLADNAQGTEVIPCNLQVAIQ